ncbi:MAG: flagellar basal body-associated FliL family protein [Geopsychrobacter sp.]|nr:flagellar basal body-associated FliL family protein [Geopsychrobacter sp.]
MAKKAVADASEEGGGSKKKLIIIIAAVVLLAAIGGGAAFFLMGDKEKKPDPEAEAAALAAQAKAVGPMVNIDTFIVNILDDEENRYPKAAITLEVDPSATADEINARLPQLQDAILLLIGNKTFSELRDMQGKMQLRAELLNRINEILSKGKVKRIYFTDFVVQ